MMFHDYKKEKEERNTKTGVFIAGAATGAAVIAATAKVLSQPENKKKVQQVYKAVKKGSDTVRAFVDKRNEVQDAVEPVVKTAPAVKRAVRTSAKRLSKIKTS